MSARMAMEVAECSGVSIAVRDGRLSLRADSRPPESVLDLIKAHRAEILAILYAEADAKSVRRTQTERVRSQNKDANDHHIEAWTDWNERAAIFEFDGGESRSAAETAATLIINGGAP